MLLCYKKKYNLFHLQLYMNYCLYLFLNDMYLLHMVIGLVMGMSEPSVDMGMLIALSPLPPSQLN